MGNLHTYPVGYTLIVLHSLKYSGFFCRILHPSRQWSVEQPWHFLLLIRSLSVTWQTVLTALPRRCTFRGHLHWPGFGIFLVNQCEPRTHFTVLLGTWNDCSWAASGVHGLTLLPARWTADGWRLTSGQSIRASAARWKRASCRAVLHNSDSDGAVPRSHGQSLAS